MNTEKNSKNSRKYNLGLSGYKIAIVGKGGSGKSSISWLLSMYHLSNKTKVVAVDADHNANLAPSLGHEVDSNSPTVHHSHDQFLNYISHNKDEKWFQIAEKNAQDLPALSIDPADPYTKNILIKSEKHSGLKLILSGLSNDDVIVSGRCAHGNVSPLKYYLPLVEVGDHVMIVDGVAGVDMLNFGLFAGVDALIVVEEDHINSQSVSREIVRIAKMSNLPYVIVRNKIDELSAKSVHENSIDIKNDRGVRGYDYSSVLKENIDAVEKICREINNLIKKEKERKSSLIRVRDFERMRRGKVVD